MTENLQNNPKRIIIIGYMGAGKTTLGRALSKILGFSFYDLDWYIETRMRKSIAQIFEQRGEEGFRTIECNMLHEVAEFENVIISCGGGTPCFFDNMEYLNQQGETVYLNATTDIICKHLDMSKNVRPLLQGKSSEEVKSFVDEQVSKRNAFYMKAKHIIEVPLMDSREKIFTMAEQLIETIGISKKA
ncbi:shikimate kinase [Prevotella aurantiaca]|jgi:shikimate kinase|uniref:shikimate kinase n=1 Tax=Prevotella aurantiaca TaxID=596085 RepID=UPI00288C3A72|nr:shikimate kinase [Prevotella aurantiaca]